MAEIKNNFSGDRLSFYSKNKNISSDLSKFIPEYKTINRNSIIDFLLFSSILPPSSPLVGVNSMFPGEYIREDGSSNYEYSNLNLEIINKDVDYFVEKYDCLLKDFFSKYNDQNNVVFLSGGIDSAIILSYLKDYNVQCVTWGGWGVNSSDVKYAKQTAKEFKVDNHFFTYPSYEEDLEAYKELIKQLKIPILFSNAVPFIKMSKKAKEINGSNVFIGQNVDTLFMSYKTPIAIKKLSFLNKFLFFNPLFFSNKRSKFLFSTKDLLKLLAYYKSSGIFPGDWIKIPEDYFTNKNNILKQYIKPLNINQRIVLTEQLLTESRKNQICQNEIPNTFGLNSKLPYYSKEFIELTLRIPNKLIRKDKYSKYIFKALAKKRGVPEDVISHEKKGLSYGYIDFIKNRLHIPIWNNMEKDEFLNTFIDIKKIRASRENDYFTFDVLRSLYYWGELVVKKEKLQF